MKMTIDRQIEEHLDRLAPEQQRRVLEFARALAETSQRGVTGASLRRFCGGIDAADLAAIAGAIDEACERVRTDEW